MQLVKYYPVHICSVCVWPQAGVICMRVNVEYIIILRR